MMFGRFEARHHPSMILSTAPFRDSGAAPANGSTGAVLGTSAQDSHTVLLITANKRLGFSHPTRSTSHCEIPTPYYRFNGGPTSL